MLNNVTNDDISGKKQSKFAWESRRGMSGVVQYTIHNHASTAIASLTPLIRSAIIKDAARL